MQYDTPTNKEQLYDVLAEIFAYYRIHKVEWDGVTLKALSFEKMKFTELSQAQLLQRARILVSAEHNLERHKALDEYEKKINEKQKQIEQNAKECEDNKLKVVLEFDKSIEKVEEEAMKRGILNSTVTTGQIALLEQQKNQSLLKLETALSEQESILNSEIEELTEKLEQLKTFYNELLDKRVTGKAEELKMEQEKTARSVFEYNNSLLEKEQKSENAVEQAKATFELKYIEMNYNTFTVEQLVEMGYYTEVVNCIGNFLNTMSADEAYQFIQREPRLAVYLEHYYEDFVYLYKMKAS